MYYIAYSLHTKKEYNYSFVLGQPILKFDKFIEKSINIYDTN
jgi:hypothetical protein